MEQRTPTFCTQNLPLAAFICATRRLVFLGCEAANGSGRVSFLFDDPRQEGSQLQIEFESGAECPAVAFYDSVRHLRRVMDGTMDGTRNKGALEHDHIR